MTTGNWPQPHEGIAGAERTQDDLLSLAPGAVAVRQMIRVLAQHLKTATLVGNPAPVVARMSTRLGTPQVGDLVIEESTFYMPDADGHIKGFGILVAHREEWWTTDEEWERTKAEEAEAGEELADSERHTDHAWYVQYGPRPGDICRWTNCSFLVVPVTRDFVEHVPAGSPTPTGGTVFTRDSLLGSLADSGFALRLGGEETRSAGAD